VSYTPWRSLTPRPKNGTARPSIPSGSLRCCIRSATRSRKIGLAHLDPADRFLAATAKVYDLTLVTADERLLESSEFAVFPNR
ncbi:MAG: PIN domain-containing protein, partial [Gemmatimonadetes bacterium]|nr:PIN domain-containing protein [Gemmatimonadota bacterium]